MRLRDESGVLGFRPILILAILGVAVVWAAYNGYIKWKGPDITEVAQDAAEDASKSVKKLVK